jgi:hypothetical protein
MGIRRPLPAILTVVIASLVVQCGATGPSETEAGFWARMDAFVSGHMNPTGAGFAFAVMHDGAVAHARG